MENVAGALLATEAGETERERKYHLGPARAVALRKRIEEVATHVRGELQVTQLFDHPALGLRARGAVLRLRWTGTELQLTYKPGQTIDGADRVRKEFNVRVDSGRIQQVLTGLGFYPAVRYTKQTEVYAIGRVLVYLDEVEGLGWFCEIEARDDESDLEAVAQALGLEREWLEMRTYSELAEGETAAG